MSASPFPSPDGSARRYLSLVPARTSFTQSEQLTPRVAATVEAAASLWLLAPATRQRLLAALDHVADLSELVPTCSASWDREREPGGTLTLRFGSVAVCYRIEESDGSLLVDEITFRREAFPRLSVHGAGE